MRADSLNTQRHAAKQSELDRPPELQKRISNALRACNEMFAKELGAGPKRKRRVRRVARVSAMPDSPKLRAIKQYRLDHPEVSLREAATACGFFQPRDLSPDSTNSRV